MSNYEWESLTVTLPAEAVAPLRKQVREAHNSVREEVLRLCKEFWQGPAKRTRSSELYRQRLDVWSSAWTSSPYSTYGRYPVVGARTRVTRELAYDLLAELAAAPRQIKQSDLDAVLPKATNRTSSFSVGWEATLSFDGRTLEWHVPENNRAVEHAREHPVAEALFGALERVRWTRGTGGVGAGNNEYNREADYAGGGANYVTCSYGPLGEKRR